MCSRACGKAGGKMLLDYDETRNRLVVETIFYGSSHREILDDVLAFLWRQALNC